MKDALCAELCLLKVVENLLKVCTLNAWLRAVFKPIFPSINDLVELTCTRWYKIDCFGDVSHLESKEYVTGKPLLTCIPVQN